MKKLKTALLKLWRDESAQGATEYILLLVAVVAMIVIFKDKLKEIIVNLLGNLSDKVNQVTQ